MPTVTTDDYDVSQYNFVIHQGTTFKRSIIFKDSTGTVITLGTGASAAMKVRKSYPATQRAAAYRDSPVLSLTSSGGSPALSLIPASGQVTINVPAATMAGVTAGIYDYDLEVTLGTSSSGGDSGDVIKLLSGLFEIKQEMTY
jgi:hypothetical protein